MMSHELTDDYNEGKSFFLNSYKSSFYSFKRAYVFALEFVLEQFKIILGNTNRYDRDCDTFLRIQTDSLRDISRF